MYRFYFSSIPKLRSLLAQLGDSIADLAKMLKESEMTIGEHCNSLRQQVDLAREIAIENIHKASKASMTEIDAYECECLSHWTEAKESTEVTLEDVSKRMRAHLAEQHAFLQSVRASDTAELQLHLDAARKLAQELNDRKKELQAAMFDNQLASFHVFPRIGEASLGQLTFALVQSPFKKLDIASAKLKALDYRIETLQVQLRAAFNRRRASFL